MQKNISLYTSQCDFFFFFFSCLVLTAYYHQKIQWTFPLDSFPFPFPLTAATLPVVSQLVFLQLIILTHGRTLWVGFVLILFWFFFPIMNRILFLLDHFVCLLVLFSKPFLKILLFVNSIDMLSILLLRLSMKCENYWCITGSTLVDHHISFQSYKELLITTPWVQSLNRYCMF